MNTTVYSRIDGHEVHEGEQLTVGGDTYTFAGLIEYGDYSPSVDAVTWRHPHHRSFDLAECGLTLSVTGDDDLDRILSALHQPGNLDNLDSTQRQRLLDVVTDLAATSATPLVGVQSHQLMSADDGSQCIVCGAYYGQASEYGRCSGRTDLTHGYDTSAHSLDDCHAYDTSGHCEHLAAERGCDCDLCAV